MPTSKEFDNLYGSLSHEYLGKKVPRRFQDKYGKKYDKNDIKSFTYAVAHSKGIKIERKT